MRRHILDIVEHFIEAGYYVSAKDLISHGLNTSEARQVIGEIQRRKKEEGLQLILFSEYSKNYRTPFIEELDKKLRSEKEQEKLALLQEIQESFQKPL